MNVTIPRSFGTYRVLELIERVGGAHIYLARQTSVDRLVTLTVLPQESAQDAAFRKRFKRQVAAASCLGHPNVVRALDAGSVAGHEYIVAEYAGGRRLSTSLEEGEWFPMRRCIGIALDIARALEHLQSRLIVHRGVNPRAIVLSESGVAKLRGFSYSKPLGGDGSETWFEVDPFATRYMAPEQIRFDKDVDVRADIYGLGCVLYHLVTGEAPNEGASKAELLSKQLAGEPSDAGRLRADIPAELAAVLARCLERDRKARYATAAELVQDLEAVQSGAAKSASERPRRSPLWWLAALFRNPE